MVTKLLMTFFLTTIVVCGAIASDESDIKIGQTLFNKYCINCHGFPGRYSKAPILYGQLEKYLEKSLKDFKEGKRTDIVMNGFMNWMTKMISDKEIESIALFLSKEESCEHYKSPVDLGGDPVMGKKLVEKNYCFMCHNGGKNGGSPNIIGQKEQYVLASIEGFKAQTRPNPNMYGLVQHMDRKMIIDISSYLSSLKPCNQ